MELSFVLKLFIRILFLLYCIYEKTVNANYKWLNNLETTLKKETKMHQQLLLYENDFNNSIIYELEKSISKMIPTRVADFKTIMNEDKGSIELLPYLLKVTRVVIIPARNGNNLSNLHNILDSVAEMSQQKTRPKVLIATKVEKSMKYKEFFQMCWVKQFLDITILELKQRKDDKAVLVENYKTVDVNLHYYNPFNKKYTKTLFSKQSILFPYKLRNLHGYKMNVSLFQFPPYIHINRNSTGHILKVHGPDINLLNAMSKVINFFIKMKIYKLTAWLKVNCTKEYNTGLVRETIYNNHQIFAVQSILAASCVDNFLETCRGTRPMNMVILVPIFPNEGKFLITEWNLLKILYIFGLILMPWLISKYLNFDQRNWKLMYIIQTALGFTAPPMPVKRLERIVFLSTMLFFFLQSSFIHSTLSNSQLEKEVSHEIITYEELYAKNLTFIIHGAINKFERNDSAYEKLFNTAIRAERTFDDCAQSVNNYQNVSCYGREHVVYLSMKKIKNPDGKVRMKIFNQVHVIPGSLIYLAGGSPYPSRFDFVTTALMESGISDRWDAEYIPKVSFQQSQVDLFKLEISLTSKVLKLIIHLLVFGFTSAILVFVAEVIIHKFLKL